MTRISRKKTLIYLLLFVLITIAAFTVPQFFGRGKVYGGEDFNYWLTVYSNDEQLAAGAMAFYKNTLLDRLVPMVLEPQKSSFAMDMVKAGWSETKASPTPIVGTNKHRIALFCLMDVCRPSFDELYPRIKVPLENPNHAQHLQAVDLLGAVGEGSDRAAALLAKYLSSTNQAIRIRALYSLRSLGTNSLPAKSKLIKMVEQKASHYSAAIDILGNMGPNARDALPVLKSLTTDKNKVWLREMAWLAIARISPNDPEALAQLLELFKSNAGRLRGSTPESQFSEHVVQAILNDLSDKANVTTLVRAFHIARRSGHAKAAVAKINSLLPQLARKDQISLYLSLSRHGFHEKSRPFFWEILNNPKPGDESWRKPALEELVVLGGEDEKLLPLIDAELKSARDVWGKRNMKILQRVVKGRKK